MNDIIHILGSTDDSYTPWYGVMLTSLFENNKESKFVVHMLTGGLNQENRDALKRLTDLYGHKIHLIHVDESRLSSCPIRIGDHVSLATWFRLLAPMLLPDNVDKLLYLDGDIIIDGSVKDLWATDVSHVAIGACIDESYMDQEVYRRLGLDAAIPYTSAGVLLINLRYWREHRVMERCLDCVARMADKLLFHDQDTLNVVLQKEKMILPVKWNLQHGFLRPWFFDAFEPHFQEEIIKATESPIIIHYSGPGKPWFKYNDHPFKSYFLYYKHKSYWKDNPQINTYRTIDLVRDIIGRILRFIHLKPALYIIPPRKKQ